MLIFYKALVCVIFLDEFPLLPVFIDIDDDNDDDNDVMITCQERPGRAHCRSPRIRIREARSSWRNKVCRKSPRQGNRNK